MLRRVLYTTITLLFISLMMSFRASAQCTNAQVNWDMLDYYHNTTIYGGYVTNTMEQTQNFAIGPNYVTIATSSSAVIDPGNITAENTMHTGELAGYTGYDVQYDPDANGQTIRMTFNTEVTNLQFALYDIDRSQRLNFNAVNAASTALNINMVLQGSTILTANNNNTTTAYVTSNTTTLGNSSNQGSVIITVAGPVKEFTITVHTIGLDPRFWLSDINACVTGTFPTDYQQTGNNQPFQGPVVNQPDYFTITPDNDSVFMVDPATGRAWFLFSDPSKDFTNSLAYDPVNKILYYISENASINANNRELRKYDFNTETISSITTDIRTLLNIPTFSYGVESAAAAFYDGQLYLGFEGGGTRESLIFRIEFNGAGVPINAVQVFASISSSHDWADFVVENGILYNYNSRPGTSIVSYEHYNMMTGQSTQYLNPFSGTGNAYQSGLTWTGQQYSFSTNTLTPYNENGTLGTPVTITSAQGLTWRIGAGDASENFRPKCDFGDAPASYDPNPVSPAVHERANNTWLGVTTSEATSWDREFVKRGVSGTADSDNGVATVPFLPPGTSSYLVQASLYNNSGSNATVIAWLDFNGNGTFEAAEAGQVIPAGPVASSASLQSRYFYWPVVFNPQPIGSTTYLRIRIAATSDGMTVNHPTGYFPTGEVEDYIVNIDDYPLTAKLINFDANVLQDRTVKLDWKVTEDNTVYSYAVERSIDNMTWSNIGSVNAHSTTGTYDYQFVDENPLKGDAFYRIRIVEAAGMNRFSAIRKVSLSNNTLTLKLSPNPASAHTMVNLESLNKGEATVQVMNMLGKNILSKSFQVKEGANKFELALPSSMATGSYVLRIVMGEEMIQEKLIINR